MNSFLNVFCLFFFFASIHSNRLLLGKNGKKKNCYKKPCGLGEECFKGRCVISCDNGCPNDKGCKLTRNGPKCSKGFDFCILTLCPKGTECVSRRRNAECVPIDDSCICTQEIDPVCCNGKQYDNQCKANCAKEAKCIKGICNEEPKTVACGGILGIQCDDGFICQDDPSDNCDPECGGSDCIGICVEKQKEVRFCGVRGGDFCDEKNGFYCANDSNDNCNICSGTADCPGICIKPQVPKPDDCICTKEYKPVCCNGKTYGNQCQANCNKAEYCVAGECIFCGGKGGILCTARDAVCQDVPNDKCNPECGGIDCSGFCVFKARDNVVCNGFAGFQCEKPFICYESLDGCNAQCGGADCGGFCGTPITIQPSP